MGIINGLAFAERAPTDGGACIHGTDSQGHAQARGLVGHLLVRVVQSPKEDINTWTCTPDQGILARRQDRTKQGSLVRRSIVVP
jgi:hypothetical protein